MYHVHPSVNKRENLIPVEPNPRIQFDWGKKILCIFLYSSVTLNLHHKDLEEACLMKNGLRWSHPYFGQKKRNLSMAHSLTCLSAFDCHAKRWSSHVFGCHVKASQKL